jgi:hypothetical protein
LLVAVVGGHRCDEAIAVTARRVGALLAKAGATVVCGGLGGAMEAVCAGAKKAGGLTVGILPGEDKRAANPYVDIPLPSGMGYTRNTLVVGCADIVIALPGEYGTLSEIAFALNAKKPVIGLGSWDIKGMCQVDTPEEAVSLAKKLAPKGKTDNKA